jgi:hypothetical protein
MALYDDQQTYFKGLIAFLRDVDAKAPRRAVKTGK